MSQPPPLGNVNARMATPFWWNGTRYIFDGTTVDLARKVAALGAKPGDRFASVFRNSEKIVVPSGGGNRTPGGMWVESLAFVQNWKRLGISNDATAVL